MRYTKTELEEQLKAKEKETKQLRAALEKYEMYEGLEEAARTVKMDNSKLIEALDELISYHKSALRKVEQLKYSMINDPYTNGEPEYETVYYPGNVGFIAEAVGAEEVHYDPVRNRTMIRRKRGL